MKKWCLWMLLTGTLFLTGCGDANHGYGWSYDVKSEGMRVRYEVPSELSIGDMNIAYRRMEACTGREAHPPFVIIDDNIIGDEIEWMRGGTTFYGPPLIVLKPKNWTTMFRNMCHESAHYLGFRGYKNKPGTPHGGDFPQECVDLCGG